MKSPHLRRRLLIAAGAATLAPVAALLVPDARLLEPRRDGQTRDAVALPADASTGTREADDSFRDATARVPRASSTGSADRAGPPGGLATHARRLSFEHTHTGERLSVVYAYGDHHLPAALASLNWLLRDFRNGATHPIDPTLFDQLHRLHALAASRAPFEIISGYRSPETNAMLHRKSDGVAARSLHLVGQAIDVRLADVTLADLRDAALSLRAGGVGFYPGSNFVHLDTGRVRRW